MTVYSIYTYRKAFARFSRRRDSNGFGESEGRYSGVKFATVAGGEPLNYTAFLSSRPHAYFSDPFLLRGGAAPAPFSIPPGSASGGAIMSPVRELKMQRRAPISGADALSRIEAKEANYPETFYVKKTAEKKHPSQSFRE